MAEFAGTAVYCAWVYSGGTVNLAGNYRKIDYKPNIDLIEVTAGTDAAKTYLSAQKDGMFTIAGLLDTGGTVGAVAGTVLVEGAYGTLLYAPEGTATGKPKNTIPAISQGIEWGVSYNAVAEFSVSFQQNGARTDGVW